MNLVLHIGTPKTGTTSLQVFMAEHAALFRRQGLYPSHICFANNHIEFAMLPLDWNRANELGAVSRELRLRGISKSNKFEVWKTTFLREFQKDLAKAEKLGCENYLVSSEFLFFLSSSEVAALQDLLAPFELTVQIVFFVRNQVDMVESWYSTKIKNGYARTLSTFVREQSKADGALNWLQLDVRWSQVFGDAAVKVLVYEPGTDVRQRFLESLGAPAAELPLAESSGANSAVSILEGELIRLLNQRYPHSGGYLDDTGGKRNLILLALLGRFPGDRNSLSDFEAESISALFDASNRKLERRRGIAIPRPLKRVPAPPSRDSYKVEQLQEILNLIEYSHTSWDRRAVAQLASALYIGLVRSRSRFLVRLFKNVAGARLRARGTPPVMY